MNYCNKLRDFFDMDITEKISSNFLNLSMKLSDIDPVEIQARYSKQISGKLLEMLSRIEDYQKKFENEHFAVTIHHTLYVTKNPKLASAKIAIAKDADEVAFILRESKDRQAECPHTASKCIEIINKWIKRDRLKFINSKATDCNKRDIFNKACFNTFVNFYDMKNNPKHCYKYDRTSSPSYSYSDIALRFIYDEIKKNPSEIVFYKQLKINLCNRSRHFVRFVKKLLLSMRLNVFQGENFLCEVYQPRRCNKP